MGIFEDAFVNYRSVAKTPEELDLAIIGFPIPMVKLQSKEGLVKCQVARLEDFEFMANGAEEVVFTLDPNTQSLMYACVYKENKGEFPISRFYIYHFKSASDMEFIAKFEKSGKKVQRSPRDEWFVKHFFNGDAKKAVKDWIDAARKKGLIKDAEGKVSFSYIKA